MNHLLSILLTAILCATASAQTIKTLGYNSTNGQVVANTGTNVLTFTNSVDFQSPITIYGVSPITFDDGEAAELTRANLGFSTNLNTFWTATNAATTRTNLGLPLAALTNTSNVTMMRTLSGSTNTNHPFSGSISVTGTNNTNTLVFSNGILQSVQ